jgi:hypothetical protein
MTKTSRTASPPSVWAVPKATKTAATIQRHTFQFGSQGGLSGRLSGCSAWI